MSGLIAPERGEITHNALIIHDGMSFDEWMTLGKQLSDITKGLMFWVGDWLVYGENAYGEAYAQAMDATGYSYKTIRQAMYIARKFPVDMRDERLTFTHYTVVAGEEQEKALELLTYAAENELTVEELREKRRGNPKPKKPKMCTCPECGKEFEIK